MIKFLRDLINDTLDFVLLRQQKSLYTLYNVQCWYDKNACEVFQIVAYSEDDAKLKARNIAGLKGYDVHIFGCDFVI